MTETPPPRSPERRDTNAAGPDPHAALPGVGAPSRGRAGWIAAAVVALLAVGGGALWYALDARKAPPAATAPADLVAARLAEATDYAPFFDAIAARLPADSAQLREGFVQRAQSEPAAATADRFVADALKALRETRGVAAARADAPAMSRVFAAQGAMLAALGEADARLCVDFVYGGATDALMSFAAGHRPIFAAVARANLDAILDGGDKKIEREEPTDADFAALEKLLRDKGLGDPEIGALLDGKTPDPPLADARMCEAARLYVEALQALPEPTKSRLMALAIELMARS